MSSKGVLGIRRIDARGATAEKIFRLRNEIDADYNLDVDKHVAIA